VWHKNGVKALSKPRRAPVPLDAERLRELALRYVGKYATTRARLRQYLARKLRERGWTGSGAPDLERLAERFAELGLIDDAAYALAKSRALSARGYGKRRLIDQLRHAGVEEADGADAAAYADDEAVEAALRLARRRRIGPFAAQAADPHLRQKWIAAMVRAGHGFPLAKVISGLPPDPDVDMDQIRERFRSTEA
jgi:regulatory protein